MAEVYYASTPSVMEAMNDEVGLDSIPSGSIRIIGASESNPSVVYTPNRIKEVETKFGRSVVLDIFLRLSLNGLVKNEIPFDEWSMINQPSLEQDKIDYQSPDNIEKIDELNHLVELQEGQIRELKKDCDTLETDNKKQRDKLFQFEQNIESLTSRVNELTSRNEENLRMKKQYQKELKKERKMLGDVLPILDEIVTNHQLGSMEELTQLIRDNLLSLKKKNLKNLMNIVLPPL